jgi:glutathione S-transferase
MLTLYYSPGACSLAPHVALEEAGVPYEIRLVSIAEGSHKSAAYRAINPRERVPTMIIEGTAVTEVPALLAHVASLRPELTLMPRPGSLEHARCFELMAFLSSSLHIAYAQLWRPERFLTGHPDLQELPSGFGREAIQTLNHEIDSRVAGPWALGEHYTIADCYLLPFYRWGARIGLPMADACPRWTRWCSQMVTRPAVQRAIEREGVGFDWAPEPQLMAGGKARPDR